jgi:hypothetical protein
MSEKTGAAARESLRRDRPGGLTCLRSTLAAVPVLFAHAVVTVPKIGRITSPGEVTRAILLRRQRRPFRIHAGLIILPISISVTTACAKRTNAAASVERRRRERLALLGRGMRTSRSDTRAASQAFERMHTHASIWRKHTLTDGRADH